MSAKDILVKPIAAADANRVVRALHYSGKTVNNSQLHLGIFLGDKCGGAMQFGPSLDKRKLVGLVLGTKWNEFIELNRLALADWLPRNSESRAIGYAMRFLRKTYPWLKWVVSFADGTQCGDGTIYRASGFLLTGIRKNTSIWRAPDGRVVVDATVKAGPVFSRTNGAASMSAYKAAGFAPLPGFQLRYLYFLDPASRQRLTVPLLPFSEIDRRGAGMYRGKARAGSIAANAPVDQAGEGGSAPTPALLVREQFRAVPSTHETATASHHETASRRDPRTTVRYDC